MTGKTKQEQGPVFTVPVRVEARRQFLKKVTIWCRRDAIGQDTEQQQ